MNLTEIEKHYSESIKKYGTVSKGVGWNNEEGQILRFQKLLSICPPPPPPKKKYIHHGRSWYVRPDSSL